MKVIFRKFKKEGDVIAFMPELEANRYMTACYQHVGQHGEADYTGCVGSTVPATEAEYASLKRELEGIYETSIIVKKRK